MVDENVGTKEVAPVVEKTTAELKEELEIKTKLYEIEQKSKALKDVGGKATAGEVAEPVKEETPTEYKDRILRGEL